MLYTRICVPLRNGAVLAQALSLTLKRQIDFKTHPPSTIQLATSWGCWWLAFAISGAGDEKWEGAFLPRRHWLAFANGMSLRAALQGARTLEGSPLSRRYGSVYL